ncbi:ATP-binding protein [Amycolatopsis circi]|uniref:ATP-binding protein n=1 Tax=Amycolatopsis circi TaxID=871959 RepID=UPI000E225011|nr:ATP-binding protein [Amycolatopsis circi]
MGERITNRILGPVTGKVVQIGHADSVTCTAPPVRSRYLEWVRQIAPRELVGRARELARLARFCTAPEGPDYVWFRAEPWTGKSALMASFVLDPPAGVRIVSFFVTARSAGDDTREAFVDAVQEQLAEILGTAKDPQARNLPAVFAEAAAHCRARGERLVLAVDGLDEDRSASGHSIAALLPYPSDGLRVIAASRLNPDVPADVRPDHPLRAPEIEQLLAPSPAARFARGDMERELDALLSGEPELLGLLVAVRGGLTAPDLAELTQRRPRDVERILNSAASRSFSRRPAHWRSGDAPEIYLLGHENLQRAAEDALGPKELARHRSTLDKWARRYREAGWPADTPQYLLRGYFRLVRESGDVAALADLAVDPARHARLLDVSGNDLAALAELDSALLAALQAADPDLVRIITLETYRDNFRDRNNQIPERLPGLWAELGEVDHAIALAQSIIDPFRQRAALRGVAGAFARTDRTDLARRLADDQSDPDLRDDLRAEIAFALIEDGRRREAVLDGLSEDRRKQLEAHLAVARPDPDFARALRRIGEMTTDAAPALARLGRLVVVAHPELAERFIEAAGPQREPGTLAHDMAAAFLRRGDDARADALRERYRLDDAELPALVLGRESSDNWMLRSLVDALAEAGQLSGILDMIQVSRSWPVFTSRHVAELVETGHVDLAVELAARIRATSPYDDPSSEIVDFLVLITEVALRAGHRSQARELAVKTEELARRPVLDRRVADAVVALAGATVVSRDVRRAEILAPLLPLSWHSFPGPSGFVRFLAAEGDRAIAEKVLTGLQDLREATKPMLLLARRHRQAGDTAALARLADHVRVRMDALNDDSGWAQCVTMMCAIGSHREIVELLARGLETRPQEAGEIVDGIAELAARGEDGAALELCWVLPEPLRRRARIILISGLAEAGCADRAETIMSRFQDADERRDLLNAFVRGLGSRDLDRALKKAAEIELPEDRANVLAELARHAVPEQRRRILAEAASLDHWSVIVPALDTDELAGLLDVADRFGALYLPEDPDA